MNNDNSSIVQICRSSGSNTNSTSSTNAVSLEQSNINNNNNNTPSTQTISNMKSSSPSSTTKTKPPEVKHHSSPTTTSPGCELDNFSSSSSSSDGGRKTENEDMLNDGTAIVVSNCQGPTNVSQSIDERLESMSMDEYESFLNVCISPDSISKTDEQAEMISQLDRPVKAQPEEPPPLNSVKYSSSLQSLNKSKGITSDLASNSQTDHIDINIEEPNSTLLPNSTDSSSDKKCCALDSCSSDGVTSCQPLRDQILPFASQRKPNSHLSNSNCSDNSKLINGNLNTNHHDCVGAGIAEDVKLYCNKSSDLESASNLENSHSYSDDKLQTKPASSKSGITCSTFSVGRKHKPSCRDFLDETCRAIPVHSFFATSHMKTEEERLAGNSNASSSNSRSSSPAVETILGLPSNFSPPPPPSSLPSYGGMEEVMTENSLNNVKLFNQSSYDECNYTLPYYFNGREEGSVAGFPNSSDHELSSPLTSEPTPSTSSAAFGTSGHSSNYATVTEFVQAHSGHSQSSIPYSYIGINRGLQNSLYRNPQLLRDDGLLERQGPGSQILSKSSSCRDLNSTLETGRSGTPTQCTVKSLDSTNAASSSTGKGKRSSRNKALKGVIDTKTELIDGFRGGEDVDQLVKFIEGEAAREQSQASRGRDTVSQQHTPRSREPPAPSLPQTPHSRDTPTVQAIPRARDPAIQVPLPRGCDLPIPAQVPRGRDLPNQAQPLRTPISTKPDVSSATGNINSKKPTPLVLQDVPVRSKSIPAANSTTQVPRTSPPSSRKASAVVPKASITPLQVTSSHSAKPEASHTEEYTVVSHKRKKKVGVKELRSRPRGHRNENCTEDESNKPVLSRNNTEEEPTKPVTRNSIEVEPLKPVLLQNNTERDSTKPILARNSIEAEPAKPVVVRGSTEGDSTKKALTQNSIEVELAKPVFVPTEGDSTKPRLPRNSNEGESTKPLLRRNSTDVKVVTCSSGEPESTKPFLPFSRVEEESVKSILHGNSTEEKSVLPSNSTDDAANKPILPFSSKTSPGGVPPVNEPVIFCGDNFKQQPQVLGPEIEFGFGVNDFIDCVKPQDKVAEPKETTFVSPGSEERSHRQISMSSRQSSAEKDGVLGNHPSHVDLPSLPIFQPLTIQPNMNHCVTNPHQSPHYPPPVSMHYYAASPQQYHPSIYGLSQPLMQPSQMLNTTMSQPHLPHPGYMPPSLPFTSTHPDMVSPPIQMNLNMSPSQIPQAGQNYQNIPISVLPNMAGLPVQHLNLQPAYNVGLNSMNQMQYNMPSLLQMQQHQQNLQNIQQHQMQQQHHMQQQQQQQQQMQYNMSAASPGLPVHGDLITQHYLQQHMMQQASQAARGQLQQQQQQQQHMLTSTRTTQAVTPSSLPQNYQSPYVFKNSASEPQQMGNERQNGIDRDQRNRGNINIPPRRAPTRTYYNVDRQRHGAQMSAYQSREFVPSSSRRGSRQSNTSPLSSPPLVSPSVETASNSNESRPISSSSSHQDLIGPERKSVGIGTDPRDDHPGCYWSSTEDIAGMYEQEYVDPESTIVANTAQDYMNNYAQKLAEKEKKGDVKVHRL